MNFLDRLKFLLAGKASQARIVSTTVQMNQAISTPANYEGFAKQAYAKNVLVYSCISKIAKACAGIEWELFSKRKGAGERTEIENHELLDLLDQPNPMQAKAAFIESVVAYYLLAGNSYIEEVRPTDSAPPTELWAVRPDRMRIVGGKDGYPKAYVFQANQQSKIWEVDFVNFKSAILHLKNFNPLNDWYGMSAIEAALLSIDQNNAASKWNLSLLQNSATPSGVLQIESTDANPTATITEEQFKKLKEELQERYQGAQNAGRPLLLEGGMKWEQMALSPRDMEFIKAKEVTSLDIAQVFGVPPEMLGLGQKTFNNYKEARLSFYEETVLPLMDFLRDELNRWIVPAFGEGLQLDYDRDDIEALAYKREQKFAMIKDATYLTQNEKREAVGYDDKEGWDVFQVGNQFGMMPEDFSGAATGLPSDPNADPRMDPNAEPQDTPPPPKKPMMSDDEMGDMMDEGDKSLEWKSFNNITKVEKQNTWRKQNAHRARLTKSLSRDLKEYFKELNQKMVSAIDGISDSKLAEYAMMKQVVEMRPELKKILSRHIKYSLEDFGGAILKQAKKENIAVVETKVSSRKFDYYVNDYIQKRTGEAITQIDGTTHKKVIAVVKKYTALAHSDSEDAYYSLSDYKNDLLADFDELVEWRAANIARTEVAAASTNGSLNAARALDVPNLEKEWVSAEDDRVRDGDHGGADHAAMDGVVVPIDEKFTVPPDASMDCPLDSAGGADQVCNCRCVLTYKAARVFE